MADVKSDVASLVKQHPDWDNSQIFDALSSKYDARALASEVASQTAAATKKAASAKAAKQKADLDAYQSAGDLTLDILNRAIKSDPTKGGQTLTAGPINPLTNQPMGGAAATTAEFSNAGLSQDFGQGGVLRSAYDKTTGKYYIQAVDNLGVGRKVFIFGDPNNPKQYKYMDYEQGAQYFMQQFAGKDGISKLKNMLASNNAYANPTAARRSLSSKILDEDTTKAINKYLNEITSTNFNYGAVNGFLPIGSAAAGTAGAGQAGTRTSYSYDITPKDIAARDITKFVSTYLNRGATAKEINDWTKELNNYERNNPDKTVTTTDTLGYTKKSVRYAGAGKDDKDALLVGLLAGELQGKGINPDQISANGGLIARNMQALTKAARDYGIYNYDSSKALNSVLNTIKAGSDINNEVGKMKAMAKEYYKPLASYLDAGGTVSEMADNFGSLKRKYLETVDPTDIFDQDIQKGLLGDGKSMMNQNDYIGLLKSKPEWSKTINAREQAAEFANTILKNFGLVG